MCELNVHNIIDLLHYHKLLFYSPNQIDNSEQFVRHQLQTRPALLTCLIAGDESASISHFIARHMAMKGIYSISCHWLRN
mmetsp:Transcript_286/g.626  ORF Transcript_286/g.626 Transcript_286/m.626 type:complete len:80 (+) Transcript_286:205-444(+)